uniref:Trehalase n=1 Tax=Setaria digitata TaxID=48799 RepID=A0A915Q3K9_9BILA
MKEKKKTKEIIEPVDTKRRNFLPSREMIMNAEISSPIYPCDESNSQNYMIYCQGDLLHAISMIDIFKDPKTFVDRPIKKNPDEVINAFKQKFPSQITINDREALQTFVDEYFDNEGSDIEECPENTMEDWNDEPEYLITIEDPELRQFALEIHGLWKKLCHIVKPEVKNNPKRYSTLYLPYEFIIPGGRFREFHYWDTYWIIKGLLASGMHDTVKHILQNFKYLIEKYGYIPSGGRNYMLQRTQPPFFIPMVYEYHTVAEDDEFLLSVMGPMEAEFAFWKKHRTRTILKNGKNYTIFQYISPVNTPRAEAYRSDFLVAENVPEIKRRQIWRDINSASESGWDFSSRWLGNSKTMNTIETSNIVPVDLNALMCWNMEILAHLHGEIGNTTRRMEINNERAKFVDTFEAVFFDDHEGSWFDFNLNTGERVDDTYPSMAVPLFTECYSSLNHPMLVEVLETLQRKGLLQFPGGIPASLIRSSNQQWDYPSGFAPINHMVIEGLRKSNHPIMQQKAFELANKWINRNYEVYQSDHKLWQRYDVAKDYIRTVRGGDYDNQVGYGWTNGALLDLMVTYSKRISVSGKESTAEVPEMIENESVDVLMKKLEEIFGSWKSVKRRLMHTASYILKCN